MNIADAFAGVRKIHIETAPLIYFVEQNPKYVERMRAVFRWLYKDDVSIISSVITLTEVLTFPIQSGRADLEGRYRTVLTRAKNFSLIPVNVTIAEEAAKLRAKYQLNTIYDLVGRGLPRP